MDPQKMTPDQIKSAICQDICMRFVDQLASTNHEDLIFRYEDPDAIRALKDLDFIEGVGTIPGTDKFYLPRLGGFVLAENDELLRRIKSGMVAVVSEVRQLCLERTLRIGVATDSNQVFGPILEREPDLGIRTLQLGLKFACEGGSPIGGSISQDRTLVEQVYVRDEIVKLRVPERWVEEQIGLHRLRFENSKRDYSIPRMTAGYSVLDADSMGMIGEVEEADAGPCFSLEPLNLHPRILEVSQRLFADGHHWPAVFEATKALMSFIRERSGRMDLDGANLARTVFSKNNPILAFNELETQTDQDEQEGMMHLFTGAVLGIRNPGGHKVQEGPPQRAFEYICFLSLLAYRVQEAKSRDERFGERCVPTKEQA